MKRETKDLKKMGAGLKNPKHVLLDLFSGIGGFAKGLMDAGFEIEKHYFSEIDKHAIANYKYNFPYAEYIGAIQDVSGRNIKPTIITFGSPCQDFSLAGKRKGMDGERSSLILHAIGLVRKFKPHFFIWENVKGAFSSNDGADFWAIISSFANIGGYRCEWQLLNTSWFLPQNRERIYLVGHLAEARGRFKGIFPITESSKWSNEGDSETTNIRAITAGGHSGGHHSGMTLIRHRSTQPFEQGNIAPTLRNSDKGEIRIIGNLKGEGGHNVNNIHSVDGIAPTVRENHGKITPILLSHYGHKDKYGTGGDNVPYVNNIRRLTEIECERLQGFADDWTKFGNYDGEVKKIAKTQRYKMLGNAVSKPVVEAVAKRLL